MLLRASRIAGRLLPLAALVALGLQENGTLPPCAEAQERPGVRVAIAALDGGSGIEMRGFLQVSSRDVTVTAGARQGWAIRATARGNRSEISELQLAITIEPIAREGCRVSQATIDTHLRDGRAIGGGRTSASITRCDPHAGGTIEGTFEQTASLGGAPATVRGTFRLPVPARASSALHLHAT